MARTGRPKQEVTKTERMNIRLDPQVMALIKSSGTTAAMVRVAIETIATAKQNNRPSVVINLADLDKPDDHQEKTAD